jgi:hypothetical protein
VDTGNVSNFYAREGVRYYRLALNAIRSLLVQPQYAHSDEVLAACIILSTLVNSIYVLTRCYRRLWINPNRSFGHQFYERNTLNQAVLADMK